MTTKRGTRPKGIRPADLEALPSDWRLVRVGREKEPIAGKGWFDVDDYSPDDALGMNGSGPPAWGLKTGPASGVLVLDLDAEGWCESFQKETGHPINDLPQTISWTSGKPGRSGHAFAVDRDWWDSLANRRSWDNSNGQTAWELRWDRCQSVILGAHPETDGYRWLPERSPADIPDPAQAPAWLLECLLVQELEDAVAAKPTAEDAKRAQAMLVCLPPGELTTYDAWLRIGMALHHTDAGLLSAWVDWCRPMHNFDEAECLAKWKSFGNGHKGRPATIGTLHFLAKQYSYSEPKASRQSSKKTRERNARHPQKQAEGLIAPYRALGWCAVRSRIHYQHRETGQIASIKPAAQAGPLLQLAPIAFWESTHPGRSGIDWAAACSDVIEQANRAGVFALDRVRGRGLWQESNQIVWHLGDRLEVDGKPVALIDHRSAHHYPRLPALEVDPSLPPLSDAEGKLILDAVAAMGWSSPLDPIHLLGWAVLANVGGALDKRPVLQLTSRFGSGKTYTRERVLEPLLAGLAISRSNSTEAGIRQLLKADSLPVLIDESEGEDHSRREGHLRLARLSYDGSPTDRGTPHGQAHSYAVRSSVALVGINATISNPAERSRTVVVGREQVAQAQWAEVDQRLASTLTAETGARLLRRIVNHLAGLRANVVTFRRAVEAQLQGGAAARSGDTLGALLAGAHLLTSTGVVDDAQALEWLDSIGWSAAGALGESGFEGQDSTAEGRQCLAKLLTHEEIWRSDSTGTGRLSIRELLDLACSPSGADAAAESRKALGRRGIRAMDSGLVIANTPEPLAQIYGATKWRDGGHRARLLDLPGARPYGQVRFPVLGSCKGSWVPWNEVMERGEIARGKQ